MASDWLAALLAANQKLRLKIVVSYPCFYPRIAFVAPTPGGQKFNSIKFNSHHISTKLSFLSAPFFCIFEFRSGPLHPFMNGVGLSSISRENYVWRVGFHLDCFTSHVGEPVGVWNRPAFTGIYVRLFPRPIWHTYMQRSERRHRGGDQLRIYVSDLKVGGKT